MTDAPMWQVFAACAPESGHDPDLWFGGSDTDEIGAGNSEATRARKREAKRICRGCVVQAQCHAAGIREEHGIWAGLDRTERRKLTRTQPVIRDGWCGTEGDSGYQKHLRENEVPCAPCRRANARAKQERAVRRELRLRSAGADETRASEPCLRALGASETTEPTQGHARGRNVAQ